MPFLTSNQQSQSTEDNTWSIQILHSTGSQKYFFDTFLILVSSSSAMLPSLSFTHINILSSLSVFSILNTFLFMLSSSIFAPNFFLSDSWPLNISQLATVLAWRYSALSTSVLVQLQVFNQLYFFFDYFSNLVIAPSSFFVPCETQC